MVLQKLNGNIQKNKVHSLFLTSPPKPYTKFNFKCIKDRNIKHDTLNLLEENEGLL